MPTVPPATWILVSLDVTDLVSDDESRTVDEGSSSRDRSLALGTVFNYGRSFNLFDSGSFSQHTVVGKMFNIERTGNDV